ncbi:MAG: hypothetical protein Q9204_001819 [Flavoplaca sp. TL-2023a]
MMLTGVEDETYPKMQALILSHTLQAEHPEPCAGSGSLPSTGQGRSAVFGDDAMASKTSTPQRIAFSRQWPDQTSQRYKERDREDISDRLFKKCLQMEVVLHAASQQMGVALDLYWELREIIDLEMTEFTEGRREDTSPDGTVGVSENQEDSEQAGIGGPSAEPPPPSWMSESRAAQYSTAAWDAYPDGFKKATKTTISAYVYLLITLAGFLALVNFLEWWTQDWFFLD